MFEKLLSILPYNPSVIDKLYFYSKRIKSEKSIRRLTLVIVLIGFFVQFFAVFSPPLPTLAKSPNDLVNGGFSSAAEAANDCRTNLQGYGTILANYGISCNTVANASTITINSTDWNHQLYSMGRLPYNITGETPVSIANNTYYVRYLWGWDKPGTTSTYQALNVTSPGGQTFLLLYNCGNLTSVGFPNPVHPPTIKPTCPSGTTGTYPNCTTIVKQTCPSGTTGTYPNCQKPTKPLTGCQALISSDNPYACIQTSKSATNITEGISNANGTQAKPGDLVEYTIYAKNIGTQAVNSYVFQDNLSYVLDYSTLVYTDGGSLKSNNEIIWPSVNIDAGQTVSKQFEVKVDDPIPSTPTSTSDPNYFNLTMSNTFGNTINITLPSPPAKTIETVTTTTLPNTGPGTSLFVAALVTVFAGFFFYRTRLLSKETELVIKETVPAGE